MPHINFVKDGEISVAADAALFSSEIILKCLYWYGDKFHTSVRLADSQNYLITLKPLENSHLKEADLPIYLQKLERDLVDFQLREIVRQETQNVRNLLVAKAFSNGEYDDDPPGDVSDPVGFNPGNIVMPDQSK